MAVSDERSRHLRTVENYTREMQDLIDRMAEILDGSAGCWLGDNADFCREHGRIYARGAAENLNMLRDAAYEMCEGAQNVYRTDSGRTL
ncbi:MAG: hypothetical protein SOT60_00310 [Bilifractor sp.]|nr:hypothetical protein [Lachnospiraceae bacterium]MDY2836372.1 hypothetical protein [Bilifractor sp.]